MTIEEIQKQIDIAGAAPINPDGTSEWFNLLPRVPYTELPAKLRKVADEITVAAVKKFLCEPGTLPPDILEEYQKDQRTFNKKIREALHASKFLVESTDTKKKPLPPVGYDPETWRTETRPVSLIASDFLKAWEDITQTAIDPLFFDYLQGVAINKLAAINTRNLTPDLMGAAVAEVDDTFKVKINNYNNLKNGMLPPATLQFFDCLIIAFGLAPTRSAKIRLPLKTYMEWRNLKDTKAARQQVLESISILKSIEYKASEYINGKWTDSGFISIWGGTGYIRNGVIYFNFNEDFKESLTRYTSMPYMKDKLKINTKYYPHAYYFSRWIDQNYRMNEGKARVNTITVKTLLEKAVLLPTYEEIAATSRQTFKRIIEPFIKNLDAIEHLYYDFADENGEIIPDPIEYFKSADYSAFENAKIIIDYGDYPVHDKRIAAKEKRKAIFEKKKVEETAKIQAKQQAAK